MKVGVREKSVLVWREGVQQDSWHCSGRLWTIFSYWWTKSGCCWQYLILLSMFRMMWTRNCSAVPGYDTIELDKYGYSFHKFLQCVSLLLFADYNFRLQCFWFLSYLHAFYWKAEGSWKVVIDVRYCCFQCLFSKSGRKAFFSFLAHPWSWGGHITHINVHHETKFWVLFRSYCFSRLAILVATKKRDSTNSLCCNRYIVYKTGPETCLPKKAAETSWAYRIYIPALQFG